MVASVILPSYNRAEVLGLTLKALAAQTIGAHAFEVIIIDDGSTDDSARVVQDFQGSLRIRSLRQANRGPGAARNLGARHAAGELLIFLDADMIPYPELVDAYALAFAKRPDAIQIGRILAWPDAFRTPFDRVTKVENNHDLGTAPRDLAFYHLASGNFALGANSFARLGGFDETLRMTEDTDLGYRAIGAGTALCYCPSAVGYHNHPKSLDQRCASVRASAYWTAHLLTKHPQMAPLLPIYQDILPLRPGVDSLPLIARKLGRRTLAFPAVHNGLRFAISLLEARHPDERLMRSLYSKVLSGCRVAGFRQGWLESSTHRKKDREWPRPT